MSTANPEMSSTEDLLEIVGTQGWRNYLIFFGICFGSLVTALHTFSYQFLGATPDYWCHIQQLENTTWTEEEIKDLAIPYEVSDQGKDGKNGCAMRDLNYDELSSLPFKEAKEQFEEGNYINSNRTLRCPTRDFPRDIHTVVTQWDLVCDRRDLYSTTQVAIQAGMLFGDLLLGYLIDRYGRMFMYRVCVVMYLFGGFGTAVSRTVGLFLFLKMITAMLGHGFFITGFILAMELCSPKLRSCIGSYFLVPWAIGTMITPGIAYFIRTWSYLQIALTFPGLLLLFNFWILPESPRWLIVHKKYDEAEKVLSSIAKSNGKELPAKEELINLMKSFNMGESGADNEKKSYFAQARKLFAQFYNLVIDRKYRFRTLCVFFCWFSIAMVYYSVTIPSIGFSKNHYMYIFLGGVTELPSYLLLWPALVLCGRKKTLMILLFACAVFLLLVVVMLATFKERDHWMVKESLYLIGKFAMSSAFHLALIFTAELYPTKCRSIIIGEASAIGRLGSMCAPYINDLLVNVKPWAPSALFSIFAIASGLVVVAFPETTDKILPDGTKKIIEIPQVVVDFHLEDESEI